MPEPVSTALILAGGFGTRLRPVLADRPKPLAEVLGRPFLAWLLDWIAEAGLRRVILCTGHLGEMVEAALGDRHGPLRLLYSREPAPLGTGGALRLAEPLAEGRTVLALNGDSYFAILLRDYLDWHARNGLAASLAVRHLEDASASGLVRLDPAGNVLSFEEKKPDAGPGWINGGIYLLDRRVLQSLPADRPVSLERDVLPGLAGLRGYRSDAPFLDIGTPERYASAVGFFQRLRTE